MNMKIKKYLTVLISLSALGLTSACGSDSLQTEAKYPTGADRASTGGANNIYDKPGSVFGKDGFSLLGGGKSKATEDNGIGVNSFLWRAALDTISFMPLASADPFGGVILTDWYTPEGTTNERLKINIFIMGAQLRSDGVRVRVFKQIAQNGGWVDVEASQETARQLEDTILTRARQLRVAHINK